MGKKSEPRTGAFHESVEGQIHKGTDNKINYAHKDNQSSNKVLFLLFKDIFSGHREINGREQHNTLISKNQWLKQTYSMEVRGGDKKIRLIQDQVRSMSQRHLEWSTRDQQVDNKLESTSDEETCLKAFLGNDDFDERGDEKGDKEKEVPIPIVEECEWSFDAESHEVSLKEEMEESEKINNSSGSVCFSDDSQYVSATSFELGERVTDISDDEIAVHDVSLKEEYEPSEKCIHSVSSVLSFSSKYSSDESQQCSKKIEDELDQGADSMNSLSSYCEENKTEVSYHYSELNSNSHLSDKDTKVSDQRHGYCLTNELSYGGQLMTRFDYSALKHECIDWNIGMSSLETMGTSSFNGYNSEDKQCLAAANMLYNNDYNKEMIKKSPLSMDNRHSAPTGLKPEDADFVGSSTLTHSKERPRERSGSHGKSRGRRQRSRKHGNNKGGGRVGGAGNGGGVGGCATSDNGTNSLDGGGSGDNGDGNDDEDDRKKEKNTHKLPDEAEDNDDEDDDDDSDDDNKKGSGEKEVGATGNLLPVVSTARDKTMDKDLMSLTMGYTPPPGQSVKYEGLSSWQRESESFSIVSFVPQQEDDAPVMMDHSCISQDRVCYIIGAASGEDYLPRDDVFLPLNPCFTTLTHNMSLAFDRLDCVHCCILSRLLQHVGRCETSVSCDVCLQGYNMVLHHAKICIEKERPWSPFNRMDLCFKLCQSVRWNPEELFGPKKLYNQMMVKKYCSKILTQPFDQEVSSIDKTLHCVSDEVCAPTDDLVVLGQSDDRRKCDSATSAVVEQSSEGHGGGALKSKGGDEDVKVPRPVKSSGGQSHHTSLSRKPSNSRRNYIPPSIEEDEEDEEKEKDDEASTEESAEAILRRKYGPKDGAATAAAGFSERDFICSLPQGRINDQTQFISLVSEAKGVKGVGEVVYSNVAQLRRVANFWGQKKDEFKSTGKRPYQRAEEGVILEKHKSKFKILGTRYQLDYQWHKLTALGSGMTGRCYLATDEETGFRFCVKKIYLVDYKKEELCLWSDLDHPNIVKVYGALRHSEFIYVFIEYIDGGDLAHCIDEHKSRGERVSHWLALKYFQQLLSALVYLESKNLLHEDIKADNILLRAGDFQILLTDFGLCHRLQKPVELKDKTPAGTVTHFSPEKAASMGHGFPACVWACVCVLVHMLSGHQPWTKYLKKVDYLNFTIYMKPPPLDDVPDNIRAIVKDLIAQGFTKEAESRPNARRLLQHEAFNIINQETETYFSTLASGFQSNAGFASRALRDRNTSVRDAGAATRGTQAPQEQEVSLFEISVPQNAEMKHLSSVVQMAMAGADATEENEKFPQVPKTFNKEERQEDEDGSEEQLEGAVGGDVAQSVEKEDAQRTNIPAILNQLISSSEDHGDANETSDDVQYSDEVRDLLDPRIPLLEMLLHSSEESTVSFLTDRTSQNWNVVQGESNLEVFNPNTSTTPRSNGSGQEDQLPILSIFDQFSWDKHNPSAIDRQHHLSGNSSSGDIDSAELFAPGKEDVPTHFTEKKPADLKLNVIRGQQQQQQQQQQQEKRSSSLSRSSCSTANIATASSQGSSVFYPGTASASAAGQDFKDFFNQKEDDVDSEEDNEEDANKTKVSLVLANLREGINEDNLDGLKLTIHNGKREKLFSYRVSERDRQLPVNQHISAFKAKIGKRHFELKTMEGIEINYNSRLKVTQLMVVAPPATNQCWCAGCQF